MSLIVHEEDENYSKNKLEGFKKLLRRKNITVSLNY